MNYFNIFANLILTLLLAVVVYTSSVFTGMYQPAAAL